MSSKSNSKKVISLNQARENSLFNMLYKLHYPLLFNIVQQYVPSKEDAKEVLQDVFIKIWNNIDQIDLTNNVSGYLYRITRNTCLDFLRSKKHMLALETNIIQQKNSLNFHALNNDAASAIIENELKNLIDKSIDQLPEKCKLVFIKSRVEGLKHKQISSELNISTKTIENHITKAIKHLKLSLKGYLPFL